MTLDFRIEHEHGGTKAEFHELRGFVSAPVGPRFEIYSDFEFDRGEGETAIAELYAAYLHGKTRLRLGRMFVPIGVYQRSELYFSGFVELPLVKEQSLNGFVLLRSEQGLVFDGGSPNLRYEAGIFGGDGSQAALGLDRVRDASLRLQLHRRQLILGLNGYAGTTRVTEPEGIRRASRLLGLDWRYSAPAWIVRGEWWVGKVGDSNVKGGYLDLLFHPTKLPKWTFVGRLEQTRSGSSLRRKTVGVKYVPLPGWLLGLNWIDADSGSRGIQGYSETPGSWPLAPGWERRRFARTVFNGTSPATSSTPGARSQEPGAAEGSGGGLRFQLQRVWGF